MRLPKYLRRSLTRWQFHPWAGSRGAVIIIITMHLIGRAALDGRLFSLLSATMMLVGWCVFQGRRVSADADESETRLRARQGPAGKYTQPGRRWVYNEGFMSSVRVLGVMSVQGYVKLMISTEQTAFQSQRGGRGGGGGFSTHTYTNTAVLCIS